MKRAMLSDIGKIMRWRRDAFFYFRVPDSSERERE